MQPTQDIAYERPYTTTTTTTTTTSTTTPSSSLGDTASLWSPSYDYLIAGSHGNASTPAYFTMMTSGVSYAVEMVANNASSDSRGEGGGTGGGSWEGHNGTDRLVKALWLYLAPVLFFVGIAGNTLTVAVCRRKRLRKTTVSIFLSAMACIDNLVLLTGIVPEWLSVGLDYEIRDEHAQACKWSKFLAYTTGDAAIWILVAFTVDRFGAICFPLHKRAHLRTTGTVRLCLLLCAVASCKNVHVFWTRGPIYHEVTGHLIAMCKRPEQFVYFERYVRPWIAFATVSVIPFTAITVANVSIIYTLSKVKIKRVSEPSTCSSHLIHTAVLCLSASFTFLICIAPSIVLLIGKPYWTSSHGQRNGAYDISKAVCNILVYVNHSINFFLYCMTGGRFRQEFKVAVVSWATCGRREDKSSRYGGLSKSMTTMSRVTRGGAMRIHKDCVTTDSSTVEGYQISTPRGTLTKFNPTAV